MGPVGFGFRVSRCRRRHDSRVSSCLQEPIPWYEWAEKFPGFIRFQEKDGALMCPRIASPVGTLLPLWSKGVSSHV